MKIEQLTLRQWTDQFEDQTMEEGIKRITYLDDGTMVLEWK